MLAALVGLDDASFTYFADIVKAHVRDGGAAVKAALGLHLQDDVLQHLLLVLIQIKLLGDPLVALDQLAGREARGKSGPLGVILDQMAHGVQRAVHGPAVILRAAKVLPQRPLLIAGNMYRVANQLIHALILRSGDRHHRHAQHALHGVDVHGAAVSGQLVHHVQRHDHRHVHLQQLHRQIQIALDVGRVHDIDDRLRLCLQHEFARDQLLAGIGRHGIDPRQIGDGGVLLTADGAVLAIDGHAREIAHMLVGAGQLVEQCRLAAVLVAHEGEGQQSSVRQRLARALGMELPFLAQARVGRGLAGGTRRGAGGALFAFCDVDLFGVGKAQRQLIAVDAQLHRVAHRRKLDKGHLCAGNDPHIQKMLPQGAFASYGLNAPGLARAQLT